MKLGKEGRSRVARYFGPHFVRFWTASWSVADGRLIGPSVFTSLVIKNDSKTLFEISFVR